MRTLFIAFLVAPLFAVADQTHTVQCNEENICFFGCYDSSREPIASFDGPEIKRPAGTIPARWTEGSITLNSEHRILTLDGVLGYEVFWLPEDVTYCIITGGKHEPRTSD